MNNIFMPVLQGKTVIVGIGSRLKGDDGFGPALIDRLEGKVDFVCIDAGVAPENFIGPIAKEQPDTVLLVDAADLDLEPGNYRILQPTEILQCGLTTHDLSSRMLIELLQLQTRASICMLGVQPRDVSLGNTLSDFMAETLDEIAALIQEASTCMKPT